MKEVILITGGRGLVAKKLESELSSKYAIRFLTRKKVRKNDFEWNVSKGYIDTNALKNVKHIIHLAGANIAEKRWTAARKKQLFSSRVDAAKLLLQCLQNENITISSFISASAVGYYGMTTSTTIYEEEDPPSNGFLGNLCSQWENIAKKFKSSKIADSVIILRFGIILSSKGGALGKLLLPLRFYVGSPIGSGNQYMPWVHIDDASKMIIYSLYNKPMEGTFNAVAPEHITNKLFIEKLAKKIQKPLFFPNVPTLLLKIIFGNMATVLTEGSRISAKKILKSGFTFTYPTLEKALEDLL